jgi:hypothetical protein
VTANERSAHAIDRIGFDRFTFDAPTRSRADGATLQRGVDLTGIVLVVGSVPWRNMPIDWLALSPRRSDDFLELDIDVDEAPIVDPDLAERFIIDADDDDLTDLLDESVVSWILRTDADIGPLYLVLDGPDPDQAHPSTIYVARVAGDDESVDMRDIAVDARDVLDGVPVEER